MAVKVAVGQAFSVEGREAVAKAVYEARVQLGNEPISFAVVIASYEYDFHAISKAALTHIGEVPIIGFSTSGEITATGSHRRSVVVTLVSCELWEGRTEWLPAFGENSQKATEELVLLLNTDGAQSKPGLFMVVADGLAGNYEDMVNSLPTGKYQLAGCLAGGDMRLGRTYQQGGDKFGSSGLAGMFISGEGLRVGVGAAHGWHPVGASFHITGVKGQWVMELDGKPASERYADLFGQQAKDWAFPPLNTLVRLYPLGIERENLPLLVRTPMRVEADGSLQMNTTLSEGAVSHLLVGSRETCLEAARQAVGDALQALGDAEPVLALVLVDASWQMLFQGYEGAEVAAIREALGENVPLAGGYTFGQVQQPKGAPKAEFLNQHIEIVLIGHTPKTGI